MKPPFAIAVSPTGAGKTRDDHPNLPLTPGEIAKEAAHCLDAGACMLHLHVRRPDLRHSLGVEDYRAAIDAIRRAVGNRLVIQVTTEAVNQYSSSQQIEAVKSLKPEAASIALREVIRSEKDVSNAAAFFEWMYQENVIPQFVLYSPGDVEYYFELRRRGVIPGGRHWALFVLGRYSVGQAAGPADLLPFLDLWRDTPIPWAVCAFGPNEAVCAAAALALGGHARVGFENNLFLPDGRRAFDNSELVAVVARAAHILGFPLAAADAMRGWFA